MITAVAGQVLLLLLLGTRKVKARRNAAVVAAVTTLAMAAASWVAYKELTRELETMDTVQEITADVKLKAWEPVADMITDFWPAGIGRGAVLADARGTKAEVDHCCQ